MKKALVLIFVICLFPSVTFGSDLSVEEKQQIKVYAVCVLKKIEAYKAINSVLSQIPREVEVSGLSRLSSGDMNSVSDGIRKDRKRKLIEKIDIILRDAPKLYKIRVSLPDKLPEEIKKEAADFERFLDENLDLFLLICDEEKAFIEEVSSNGYTPKAEKHFLRVSKQWEYVAEMHQRNLSGFEKFFDKLKKYI